MEWDWRLRSGAAEVVVGLAKWMACVCHFDHFGGNLEGRSLVLLGESVWCWDILVASRRFWVGLSAVPFLGVSLTVVPADDRLASSENTDLRR